MSKKAVGIGAAAIAAILLFVGWRLYRLSQNLTVITGVEGLKMEKGKILIRTVSRLKNPTASALSIRPPFVQLYVNDTQIGSTNIPDDPKPIEIAALAETPVPNELEIGVLDAIRIAPQLLKKGSKIRIKTFVRFGPFGLFSATQEDVVEVPSLTIPVE